MISLAEAHRILASRLQPLDARPSSLECARGCVLAECVLADTAYPSADRSTMDGYALGADAAPGTFRVVGEIQAGTVEKRALKSGECYRVFTGAPLPEGTSRVIMQEDAVVSGESVAIAEFSERTNIRREGSEAELGDVVLHGGTVLASAELAMLAQVGAVRPKIVRPPTVRHIATGSEVVPPGETPRAGQIRDTNTTLLRELLHSAGVREMTSGHAADDVEAIVSLGSEPSDLLLISGGASVGAYDFGAEALRRLGYTVHFDRVNLRPGKPLTFATQGNRAAFVIPGNPVSHFVCYHVAIRLAVEQLMGMLPRWNLARVEVRGGERLQPDARETYWPARAFIEDGCIAVAPKRWSTSGNLFALVGTNALVRVGSDSPSNGRADALLLDAPAQA